MSLVSAAPNSRLQNVVWVALNSAGESTPALRKPQFSKNFLRLIEPQVKTRFYGFSHRSKNGTPLPIRASWLLLSVLIVCFAPENHTEHLVGAPPK